MTFSLSLPAELANLIQVTGGAPPDPDAPWDPLADAPFGVLETVVLDPVPPLPPAGKPWGSLDQCPRCKAPERQPCRDLRATARPRTPLRPHRGRPPYIGPGYAAFLLHKFGGGS